MELIHAFKDQDKTCRQRRNASEFDSCLLISSSNVTELTNKLKAEKIKTSPTTSKNIYAFHKLKGMSLQMLSRYPESLKEQQLYLKLAEEIKV
ncbi:MAG: hypothetical protein IPP34_18580 [Bacteroidetes bacterium]|nr:hypothetical protein [Bacteroidota bacterium]